MDQTRAPLYEALKAMRDERIVPFDVPGHKRGRGNPALTDAQLLDAIAQHPILIQRPIVQTALGVRLCRPSEVVLDILPNPQRGAFTKEDGEVVVGKDGQRA